MCCVTFISIIINDFNCFDFNLDEMISYLNALYLLIKCSVFQNLADHNTWAPLINNARIHTVPPPPHENTTPRPCMLLIWHECMFHVTIKLDIEVGVVVRVPFHPVLWYLPTLSQFSLSSSCLGFLSQHHLRAATASRSSPHRQLVQPCRTGRIN